MSTSPRRIDQLLASLGYGSRREVAGWCRDGRITGADGTRVDRPEAKATPDALRFDGQPLDHPEGIFVALHKPLGCVCSHDEGEGPLVYDLLPARWRQRNPVPTTVGRLDKETSGLLLVTDRGQWVHRLTSPKHHVEKVYLATTADPVDPALVGHFASGTLLLRGDGLPCLPARLEITGPHAARVVLTEGRYHQVRRMFAACGNRVLALHRESFGPYRLDGLAPGAWRDVPAPDGRAYP
jgi:16S rRNA pseudouridine516 synthase